MQFRPFFVFLIACGSLFCLLFPGNNRYLSRRVAALHPAYTATKLRLSSRPVTVYSPREDKCATPAPRIAGLRAPNVQADPFAMGNQGRIPVTVVTGFLGSGKTTLLNRILTESHGKRIAVIENEFGEIGIDQDLVALKTGGLEDNIMMLNNGCLCCTVREDLISMLIELSTKYRDKFDHILIETTGLAAIAPIIHAFFIDYNVASNVALDGIITLVDAKHVTRHLDDGVNDKREDGSVNEALEQIAYADRIVLNKVDLVLEEELVELESRLKDVNGMAKMIRTTKANVPVDYVLGVGGFDLDKFEEEMKQEEMKAKKEETSHSHDHQCSHSHTNDHSHEHEESHNHDGCNHDHNCNHEHHSHDVSIHSDRVSSVSVEIEGDVDYDKVDEWLGELMSEIHEDLYRMKGILAVEGFDDKYVFQGVHSMFEGTPHEKWKDGEQRKSKIVFIGKDLPKERIKSTFVNCRADASVDVVED